MTPVGQPESDAATGASMPAEAPFRSAGQAIGLDWSRLATFLNGRGYTFSWQGQPRQFAGGLGNLNYLIEIDAKEYVLRRPPLGPIPLGANDMAREARVLQGLGGRYPYAPQCLLFCADPEVLGAPFLIMEYRPGLVIRGQLPVELQGQAIGNSLVETMVQLLGELHAIDPASVGLGDFGKPKDFLQRTVENWIKRALNTTADRPRAVITDLAQWLRANRVLDGSPTLLHSDFKLDNVVLDPPTLKPRAVLDWDMATRGDPLFDLATLLSYYTEADDPPAMHELRQMPTGAPGFPRRRDVVRAYSAATGRDIADFLFYRVLAMFKLGIVFLQLYARYRAGTTQDERFAGFENMAYGLLDFTHEIAQGRAF